MRCKDTIFLVIKKIKTPFSVNWLLIKYIVKHFVLCPIATTPKNLLKNRCGKTVML